MAAEIITVIAVVLGAWFLVGGLLCNEMFDEKRRWWCPICLIFGKRKF